MCHYDDFSMKKFLLSHSSSPPVAVIVSNRHAPFHIYTQNDGSHIAPHTLPSCKTPLILDMRCSTSASVDSVRGREKKKKPHPTKV